MIRTRRRGARVNFHPRPRCSIVLRALPLTRHELGTACQLRFGSPPLVAVGLTQIAVIATSIYLHRGLRASGAGRSTHLPICVSGGSLASKRAAPSGVGGRPSQASRVHGQGRRSPIARGCSAVWRVQLLNAYYYMREARIRRPFRSLLPTSPKTDWIAPCFPAGLVGLGLGIAFLILVLGVWPGLIAALTHAVLYVGRRRAPHQRRRTLAGGARTS